MMYKYSSEWTKSLESMRHWEFYWFQQKLMEDFTHRDNNESILEIGIGSGFASNYCRTKGFNVTTLDIDREKKPDIIANAVDFEFSARYDHLMAFEILEHMPYDEFEKIIHKIPQFVKRYAFISLPRSERSLCSLTLKLPKIPALSMNCRILARNIQCKTHHWELDHRKTTTKRVEKLFETAGLTIKKRMKHEYIRFYALGVN